PLSTFAWGDKGHLMVNRLAIETAGPNLPDFMSAARDHIIYNGPEPDRWRDEGRASVMNTTQAADHFLDSELWGPISTIPADRYSFMEQVAQKKVALIKVGYLPYAIIENYGKLVNAFRFWRNAKSAEDRESARENAVYVAAILGHYVGDSTMPMHLSIEYDGWLETSPNPKGYTTARGFHSRYESQYVNAAIQDDLVRPKVRPPQRLSNVWDSIKQNLITSFGQLEPAYDLEKAGEFNPQQPRPRGTEFIAGQLARASTLLGDLWYTAWLESGEPVPGAKQ
ncbi:MAG TPA: hypothetical protein VGK48_21245, partial [Terriglobia bacterium]